ncbi:MAG: hypothetical protein IKB62_03605 [Oscillospiraceae bacterium]|nr:hypothetical protein [Oscillospiraceae bacterium]
MKVIKKLLKIAGLYLLFGFVIAVVFSAFGGYRDFVINQVLGPMTTIEYIGVLASVSVVGWFPIFVNEITSEFKVFAFPYSTYVVTAVVVIFLLLCLRIIFKKLR